MFKLIDNRYSNKIFALVITSFILGLLIFAGPVRAFVLGLNINGDSVVEQGKKIMFTLEVEIESEDNLPDEIRLIIYGEDSEKTCTFDITGKMKPGVDDECHGINIKKIPKPEIYGYGYGSWPMTLTYEITLHTQKISAGEFSTELEVVSNGNVESIEGPDFTVTEKEKGK